MLGNNTSTYVTYSFMMPVITYNVFQTVKRYVFSDNTNVGTRSSRYSRNTTEAEACYVILQGKYIVYA